MLQDVAKGLPKLAPSRTVPTSYKPSLLRSLFAEEFGKVQAAAKNHKNNCEEGLKTLRSEALQTWTRYRIVQGINNFLFLLLVHDGCTAALWPET